MSELNINNMIKFIVLFLLFFPSVCIATEYQNISMNDEACILVMSDPHFNSNWATDDTYKPKGSSFYRIFRWAETQTVPPTHVIITGDISTGSEEESQANFVAWFDTTKCTNCRLVPVIGNHDLNIFNEEPGADSTYSLDSAHRRIKRDGSYTYTDIYSYIKNVFSIFGDDDYYSIDVNSIRLIVMNNIADTVFVSNSNYDNAYLENGFPGLGLSYWQAHGYANGNPYFTNEDPDGIIDPNSTMNQFILTKLNDSHTDGITWNLIFGHRAFLAPYFTDSGTILRYVHNMTYRKNIIDPFISAGANIFCQGDLHICSLSERMSTFTESDSCGSPSTTQGAWFLATRSNYVPRDTSTIGGTTIRASTELKYAVSKSQADNYGKVNFLYAAYLHFVGDACELKIVRAGYDYGSLPSGTTKDATVVYSTVLRK